MNTAFFADFHRIINSYPSVIVFDSVKSLSTTYNHIGVVNLHLNLISTVTNTVYVENV